MSYDLTVTQIILIELIALHLTEAMSNQCKFISSLDWPLRLVLMIFCMFEESVGYIRIFFFKKINMPGMLAWLSYLLRAEWYFAGILYDHSMRNISLSRVCINWVVNGISDRRSWMSWGLPGLSCPPLAMTSPFPRCENALQENMFSLK